jgi:polygalacturonase
MKNILMFFPLILFFTTTALKSETYNIINFGAVADGKTINTLAIQKAINKCRQNGGGTVLIPSGTFISGTIQLFSNIDLHLEKGAILKGSNKVSDYYLNGKKLGLIYTENSDNISISGEGNIDGNGDAFMNLIQAKVFDSVSTKYTRQKNHFREVLKGLGDGPLVPLDRPFQMIIFSNCKNVTFKNVLVTNSPFWTIHFADCDGVIVSGVRVWNNLLVPNNDGIDLTSCSNVQISDCDIRTGDDAFAITGYAYHFDLPGYKNIKHVSENITITNCYLVSRSSAIRVGGWDQNDMQNYTFNNIIIDSSNRGINLCLRDQGSIKDMIFSNIIIHTRMYTGDWWGNGEPIHISAIRGKDSVKLGTIEGIKFTNIIAKGESGILLYCSNESEVKDISFNDISFTLNESKLNSVCGGNFDLRPTTDPKFAIFSHNISAFYAENVKNIKIQNFDLKWGDVKENYFTNGIEFKNFKNISVDRYNGEPAPNDNTSAAIFLKDGKEFRITNSFITKPGKKFLIKENVK